MAQPNMGRRKLYATRPTVDIAREFEREAISARQSYSQLLADIVAARYSLPLPSQRWRTKRSRMVIGQQVLPGGEVAVPMPADLVEPRALYTTRLPMDVATAFEREESEAAIGYSQLLVEILADRYQLPGPRRDVDQLSMDSADAEGREVAPLVRAS